MKTDEVKNMNDKKNGNFAIALGVSEKRIEEIVEMATQTIQNSLSETTQVMKTGDYDKLFGNVTKLQKEDVKLLKSVEEGIVYGYAVNELVEEARIAIRQQMARSLADLIESSISDFEDKKRK
jgi:hypothetical protein